MIAIRQAAALAPLLAVGLARAEPADLIVRGAAVITMDPARPTATAVAWKGRYVSYVGDDAGAERLRGPATRVLSCGERACTVLPGLIDAHAHLVGLGLSAAALDLRGVASAQEIGRSVAAAKPHRGAFVLGRGWDQNRFPDQAMPHRRVLDAAAPGVPVYLRRIDGHAAWASSATLRLARIDADGRRTADPPGGQILRDERGEPTGVFIDNAMDLLEAVLPAPSAAELDQAIERAAQQVLSLGLTGVHEMGLGPAEVAAYQRLQAGGRLPLRVAGYLADPVPGALAQLPDAPAYQRALEGLAGRLAPPARGPYFSVVGIKLYMDGALGSRGAALLEDYRDAPGHRGLLLAAPGHVRSMARWAQIHGYQIATHAIGDRANRLVLAAYADAGAQGRRFRVEHVQVLTATELLGRRFAQLGVIASVQPQHAVSDGPWAGQRLGAKRLELAYAWRSLLSSGARLAAGSDFPVEEPDPRLGLHAALWRQDPALQPPGGYGPGQRLTLGEALRGYTADAAYAAFMEDQQGQIRVGWPADLTVLDGALDLAGEPPRDLPRRAVRMTVVDGRVAYEPKR